MDSLWSEFWQHLNRTVTVLFRRQQVKQCDVRYLLGSTEFVGLHEALHVINVDDLGSRAHGARLKTLVRVVQIRDHATDLLSIVHLSVALHQVPERTQTQDTITLLGTHVLRHMEHFYRYNTGKGMN